jgi:osmotically-inducible protein OsmY
MATVATITRTDEDLQRDVLDELRWEPQVDPTELGVIVKDGVVTLTGWVDTYLKRMAAQEAAHRVRGVKAVANEIETRLASTAERGDTDLAAAAVRALEWDAEVPIAQIDLTVAQGWITLKGEVDWQYQRRAAERVIRRLSGVKGVANHLVVKPHLSVSGIKEQIERALVRSAETDAARITVEVRGSTIVLKGQVSSLAEKGAAERVAWSAPGVTAVDDRITVAS